MPCKAVLFDFGGVFIDSPFPRLVAASEALGVEAARLIELTVGPFDRDTDHPWHQLERGELSIFEARDQIIDIYKEAGFKADPFALLAKTIGPEARARSSVVECARSLRASGIKVGLVTNNAKEVRDRWRSMIPADDLFDDVVDSSEVGVRKPDPKIFELALQRLGQVDPRAAIFLDDLLENVAVAVEIGMQGILVEEDFEPAIERLRSLVESE